MLFLKSTVISYGGLKFSKYRKMYTFIYLYLEILKHRWLADLV